MGKGTAGKFVNNHFVLFAYWMKVLLSRFTAQQYCVRFEVFRVGEDFGDVLLGCDAV
jgi:hypothetical protein